VVLRTPQISEHAQHGPPSPTSSRSGGSFAERSPLAAAPLPPSGLSQGYASSETSSIERPARRRRTDPRPEFTMPSYGPPIPTLPPMPPSAPLPPSPYSMTPPRPPSASLHMGPERLPPIRFESQQHQQQQQQQYSQQDHGRDAPGPPGGPTYPPFGRLPHEGGWPNREPPGPPSGQPPEGSRR
jgi:hypothetical protein